MVETTSCPSHLELARIAAGVSGSPFAGHVESCQRCSSGLARLQQPVAVPDWARGLAEKGQPGWVFQWRWLVAATAGVLAVLVVISLPPRPPTEPSITAKGAPSVAVYVKRGDSVMLWDGQRRMLPGDRLRLKVFPEGFGQVAAVAIVDGAFKVLYRGAVPPGVESFLPASWKVDVTPAPNHLGVVFSLTPLGDGELEAALRDERRSDVVWTTSFVLSPSSPTESP